MLCGHLSGGFSIWLHLYAVGGQSAVRILGFGSFLGNGLDSKTATKRFSLTANSFTDFFSRWNDEPQTMARFLKCSVLLSCLCGTSNVCHSFSG